MPEGADFTGVVAYAGWRRVLKESGETYAIRAGKGGDSMGDYSRGDVYDGLREWGAHHHD